MNNKWVIIDTETDGLYYPIHVLEVAAQKMDGVAPDGEPFRAFINHNVDIPDEAFAVHGYTREYLAKVGQQPVDVYKQLNEYVGDRRVASHYLSFDWDRTLIPELYRLGLDPVGQRGLCTWLLSRRAIYEVASHKLDVLREYFSLKTSKAHSAQGDVESVVDLISRVIGPRLADIGFNNYEEINYFSRLCPLHMCRCMVQGLDYTKECERISGEKKAAIKEEQKAIARFQELYGRLERDYFEKGNISALLDELGVIEEQPDVEISGRVFLFTGKMRWGVRSKVFGLIEKCGGVVSKAKYIQKKVDYLVLGEDVEAGWTHRFGGKISDAVQLKMLEPDIKLKIILETDFIAAINMMMENENQLKSEGTRKS